MAAPYHHDGRSEIATELAEITDPALLRLHLRRLSSVVDELVARQAGPAPATRDLVWALEQQLAAEHRRGRARDLAALVMGAALVGWTGVLTAVVVAVMVSR